MLDETGNEEAPPEGGASLMQGILRRKTPQAGKIELCSPPPSRFMGRFCAIRIGAQWGKQSTQCRACGVPTFTARCANSCKKMQFDMGGGGANWQEVSRCEPEHKACFFKCGLNEVREISRSKEVCQRGRVACSVRPAGMKVWKLVIALSGPGRAGVELYG